jgi:hypothetical protein
LLKNPGVKARQPGRLPQEFGKAHYFNKKIQQCQIVRAEHNDEGSHGLWITPLGRLESRFRTRAT